MNESLEAMAMSEAKSRFSLLCMYVCMQRSGLEGVLSSGSVNESLS